MAVPEPGLEGGFGAGLVAVVQICSVGAPCRAVRVPGTGWCFPTGINIPDHSGRVDEVGDHLCSIEYGLSVADLFVQVKVEGQGIDLFFPHSESGPAKPPVVAAFAEVLMGDDQTCIVIQARIWTMADFKMIHHPDLGAVVPLS